MFGKFGTQELLIIFGIVLLIFGPAQLPKLGRTFGTTIRNFRESMDDVEGDADQKE